MDKKTSMYSWKQKAMQCNAFPAEEPVETMTFDIEQCPPGSYDNQQT